LNLSKVQIHICPGYFRIFVIQLNTNIRSSGE
jgi:hypothetical protein